jgi:hypothetical protein
MKNMWTRTPVTQIAGGGDGKTPIRDSGITA